jgi:hypothetical protein
MCDDNMPSVCIVDGLARPDEEQTHAALPCPLVERQMVLLRRPLPDGRAEGPRGRQAKVCEESSSPRPGRSGREHDGSENVKP